MGQDQKLISGGHARCSWEAGRGRQELHSDLRWVVGLALEGACPLFLWEGSLPGATVGKQKYGRSIFTRTVFRALFQMLCLCELFFFKILFIYVLEKGEGGEKED